jgi:hypothetical protein
MHPNFSISRLLDVLFPWRGRRLAEQLGGQLANECQSDLRRQGCRQSRSMSVGAIRGYVRAQAGGLVGSRIDAVLSGCNIDPALRARVVASAIDQLVGMGLRDVLNGERPISRRSLAA